MDLEWMLRDGSEPRFQIIERIGHGAFGEVFKARDLLSDEIVAIKRIFRRQPKRSVDKSASNEVSILKTLRHRNIVELIDVHRQSDYLTLEFEFCPTDLGTLLKRNPGRRFSNTLATCIIREVLIGLQFCHNAGVMHRDLKPSNILISRTGEIKIADFGQGRFVVTTEDKDNCYTPTVTSRWYRAPELLFSSRDYDSSIDIWAVGMIFAELLGGEPIICGESDLEQISLMIKSFGSIDVESWPEAMELPDYGKIVFDSCKATPFKKIFPFVSSEGIEFLEGALKFNHLISISHDQVLLGIIQSIDFRLQAV